MQTRSMTKKEAIPISFEIREIVADYISGAKNKGSARNKNRKMENTLKELSVDIDFDDCIDNGVDGNDEDGEGILIKFSFVL